MRVIAKSTLRNFWEKHSDSQKQLKVWFYEARKANWKNHEEIKMMYPSASILRNNRIVFNIKGNRYRLIIRINFDYKIIWIRFIGTHEQYGKINAEII